MKKRNEPKVAYGWADPLNLYDVSRTKPCTPDCGSDRYTQPVAIIPRARYRELLAAERERDALKRLRRQSETEPDCDNG